MELIKRETREALELALRKVKFKGRAARTVETYKIGRDDFIKWAKDRGTVPTVDQVAVYIEELKGERSGAYVNQHLYALKAAFMEAAERAGVQARELALIRGTLEAIPKVKIQDKPVSVITQEERRRLLEAMPERIRLISEFLYQTGARVTEAINVKRDSDIKVNGNVDVRLYGKGGKERTVRITRELLDRIDRQFTREGRELLFETETGGPYKRGYLSREIGRASRRALGRRVTPHVLRHSRATDLYQDTKRIKAVGNLLGHSSTAVTTKYYVNDTFNDEDLFKDV